MRIFVNGIKRAVRAESDTPLLWVIRDEWGLCGTKYGCGIGVCGACTVHLDGIAIRSCTLPVSSAHEHRITTIEGLSPTGDHPVQKAWVAEDVPQCGYCQSGQIMSAAALLTQHPRPNDQQIHEAMAGNLCRCGTYTRIRRAIQRAAASHDDHPPRFL